MYTACTGSLHGSYTAVYGPCTRPCNVSCARYTAAVYTAREHVFARRVHGPRRHVTAVGRVHGRNAPCTRSCTRPIQSRVHVRLHAPCTRPRTRPCMGRAHGPSTPPVYMTVYGPSARKSSARLGQRTRPRTRDMYTAVYGPCTRPCTRHVYGRVHVSTCTRAVYTVVYGPSTRPKTAVYTAVYSRVTCRVYGRVRAVSARVHGSVRAMCTAVYTRRVHCHFRPST